MITFAQIQQSIVSSLYVYAESMYCTYFFRNMLNTLYIVNCMAVNSTVRDNKWPASIFQAWSLITLRKRRSGFGSKWQPHNCGKQTADWTLQLSPLPLGRMCEGYGEKMWRRHRYCFRGPFDWHGLIVIITWLCGFWRERRSIFPWQRA